MITVNYQVDGWGRSRPSRLPGPIAVDNGSADGWGRRDRSKVEEIAPMDIENTVDPVPSNAPEHSCPRQLPTDHVLPGMDGVPIAELNQTYASRGLTSAQIQLLKKKYYTVFDNNEVPHKTLFTAIFTCPLTGEHFASGEVGSPTGGDAVKVDDVYWYKSKKEAMIAAAARTLDVFSLRRCQGIDMQPFRRCRDAPYLYAQDAPHLPDLPRNVSLPTKLELEGKPKLPPKRALKEWYNAFHSKLRSKGGTLTMDDPDKSCFATWSNLLQGSKMRFTSVYTCPLTGERFASGMLRGEDNYVKDYMVYDSEKEELVSKFKFNEDVEDKASFHKIDFIWYTTKKDAEDSAAARAVDCLLFRYPALRHIVNRCDTPHIDIPMSLHMKSPDDRCRYCEEEAYDVDSAPALWKTISNSVDWVLQFDQSNGDIKFYFVTWARIPDSSEVTEEFLRSVLDDEGDKFLQKYKVSRGSIQNNFKSGL